MEHGFLDRYGGLNSPVHRLDPRVKAVMTPAFAVIVVSTPPQHLLAFVIYAGLLAWTAALARVPPGHLLARAAMVLPFSALVALGLPFLVEGPAVEVLGLRLSKAGLWLLAGVTMKSFLCAGATALLFSTTPFDSLLRGLRRLRLPAIFVDLLSLTYRYIFVLVDEAMRLRRAAAARGYRPRALGQALLIGRLIGGLFLRSYERAERVYGAMLARGYTGRMPASVPLQLGWMDAAVLVVLLPALATVRMLAR